ncbi:Major facilitator superfamily (MFS) profile [Nakaseomyces glabratus]|nr:Major facilitator superfamily (MFS) profile [Nakaseomyces glabratus]
MDKDSVIADTRGDASSVSTGSVKEEPVRTNAFGQRFPTGVELWAPLGSLVLCLFLAALDVMIVSTIIEEVSQKFGDYSKVGWLFTGYSLPNALLVLIWGRIATLVGFKTSTLAAIVIFEVGSLVSALANSMDMLIGGRVVAGIGGSGVQSLVFVISSTLVEERNRGLIIAVMSSSFGIASVVGPFLGGAFTTHVTWRWCFYINLPVGGLAFFLFLTFYNPEKWVVNKDTAEDEVVGNGRFGLLSILGGQAVRFVKSVGVQLAKLRYPGTWRIIARELFYRFDIVEFVFMTLGSVLILLAFTFGGNKYKWNSGSTISMFVLGILFTLGAFVYDFFIYPKFEAVKTVPHYQPLMSWNICKKPGVWLFNIALFFVACAFSIQTNYIIQYFQLVFNDTAWKAAIHLIATVVPVVITVVSSGIVNSKTGYVKPIAIFSGVTGIIGAGLLTLLDNHASSAKKIGLLILPGVTFGAIMQSSIIGVQILLDKSSPTYRYDFIAVTTLNAFIKNIGQAYGAVLCDTVFSASAINLMKKRHVSLPGGYETSANNLIIARREYFDGPTSAIGNIISDSIINVFYMALGMFAVVVVCVVFVSNKKVDIRKPEDIKRQQEEDPEKQDQDKDFKEDSE